MPNLRAARRSATVLVLLAVLAPVLQACSDSAAESTWEGSREVRGDTVIVTTHGGSIWPSPATLVEELRIGVLDGAEEYMFGQVQEIAPDADGGVYVFDGQMPALRYYDASGTYVRTLGGEGSGPGEYRDVALGLAVRSDGRIVMRDPRNNRLNVYAADGSSSDHWPVASGLFTSNAMAIDTADHMYLRTTLTPPEPNKPWNIGLLHYDQDGTLIDSIAPPVIAGEPQTSGGIFLPSKEWVLTRFGDMVVGVTGDYAFEIRHRDGRVTRVVKVTEPLPLLPEERAELQAVNDWRRRNSNPFTTSSEIPDLPSTKPAWKSLAAGDNGRIWVHRTVQAEKREITSEPRDDRPPPRTWVEPTVYDVFEMDGTYLGEVRVPRGVSVRWFGTDHVWGTARGEFDETYVVRLRVVHEGTSGSVDAVDSET